MASRAEARDPLLAVEAELGVQIFERLPRGVRLNAAGEILIQHIRSQMSDFERVKSQIADLSGVRRGKVSIACSQALLPFFLPEQINHYQNQHPTVEFCVLPRDRSAAENALADFSADLALVFEPFDLRDIEPIIAVSQNLRAVMSSHHPLASKKTIRLRDCIKYPLALPTKPYGVRWLLDLALSKLNHPAFIGLRQTVLSFSEWPLVKHK